MGNIFLKGYTNEERHSVINKTKSVISNYGDVVDFMLFSDISLTMKIEIEEFKIDRMYNELNHFLNMDDFEYLDSLSKKERTVYLHITFTKGTGNLKVAVPSVPG